MDAKTWLIISIIGYSLSGVLLVAAVLMFFKMNIRMIIGDLTGRNAAKHIEAIREKNRETGDKRFKPDAFNVERGKLTEPVAEVSKKLGKSIARNQRKLNVNGRKDDMPLINERSDILLGQESHPVAGGRLSPATDVLPEETQILLDEGYINSDTEVLGAEEVAATELLSDGTVILGSEGTMLLTEDYGTTVLKPTQELQGQEPATPVEFHIIKDEKFIHTKEVI
ncbi:hypothetical protein LCM10_09320 [Rossellomorea aquimaris]|uniref:hypothetical protein n=1 Tax=Rossellomorea aquimaris TaxID=189382 RepID=UPI001CD3B708|nr:hypothetical protein [Rossellomorea aquimaris]MCA1055187.1 hypothetical protein [Rossellomorea aquimaris]